MKSRWFWFGVAVAASVVALVIWLVSGEVAALFEMLGGVVVAYMIGREW